MKTIFRDNYFDKEKEVQHQLLSARLSLLHPDLNNSTGALQPSLAYLNNLEKYVVIIFEIYLF